ncbi:hypothetical protein ACHRV5_00830 [Flavobacterium sp. FlaQc-52]|uniref:hypothetical protein n=1 Tax=Flavobacterium sp. FlaQc-52 TaxID=3374185 RepID=UPI00375713A4
MKKVLKKGIKFLVCILVLGLIYSFSLKTYDKNSGKETLEYWKNNKKLYESVHQNQDLSFVNLDQYIVENDLILLGEFHGIKETIDIDISLIKYLNRKVEMKIHLAEIDFSQAYFLNRYLESGEETLIDSVLNSWIVYHGHHNRDYKRKWIEIYNLNQSNSPDRQIKVYGIDKIQNLKLTQKHLKILLKELGLSDVFPNDEALFLKWAKKRLPKMISNGNIKNKDIAEDVLFIQKNLADYTTSSRESTMYLNFKYLYERYNFKEEKIYGYFGEAHVLQKEINSKKDFGALVEEDVNFKNKTYTIISRYLDSDMSAPSKFLPFFLRSENEHTKSGITCDNPFLLYHSGINEFKQLTKNNTNTFFDLNQIDSPYRKSKRLIKSFGLFSLLSGMKITDETSSTTDYAQGLVLIRNSDWAQPNQ